MLLGIEDHPATIAAIFKSALGLEHTKNTHTQFPIVSIRLQLCRQERQTILTIDSCLKRAGESVRGSFSTNYHGVALI